MTDHSRSSSFGGDDPTWSLGGAEDDVTATTQQASSWDPTAPTQPLGWDRDIPVSQPWGSGDDRSNASGHQRDGGYQVGEEYWDDAPTMILGQEPTMPDFSPAAHEAPPQMNARTSTAPQAPITPRKRRRRWLPRFIAILVVLVVVVGFVIGDATARARTEQRIDQEVASQANIDPSQVSTSIGGWPFLAVMVTNTLTSLDITVPQATVTEGDKTLSLSNLSAHARDLRNVRDNDNATAGHVEMSGRIGYDELSRLAQSDVGFAEQGRVELHREVNVLGVDVPVVVSAQPGVDTQRQVVVFTDAHAKVANLSIPESLLDSVLDTMTQSAPLPELTGVDYTDLHADEDGLTIEMSGDNVRLSDLRIR